MHTMHTMHCGSTAAADAFVPVARSGRRELLDAGDNAAFAWSFDTETYPKAAFTIRFADYQELDWESVPTFAPGSIRSGTVDHASPRDLSRAGCSATI
jgi:hypothetical protein